MRETLTGESKMKSKLISIAIVSALVGIGAHTVTAEAQNITVAATQVQPGDIVNGKGVIRDAFAYDVATRVEVGKDVLWIDHYSATVTFLGSFGTYAVGDKIEFTASVNPDGTLNVITATVTPGKRFG